MYMVFVIMWAVTVIGGLGLCGYGLYQMLEEPLQGFKKKKTEPASDSAAENPEMPVMETLQEDGEVQESDDEDFLAEDDVVDSFDEDEEEEDEEEEEKVK